MAESSGMRNLVHFASSASFSVSRLPVEARASFEGSVFAFYFYYPRYFAGVAALHGGRYR